MSILKKILTLITFKTFSSCSSLKSSLLNRLCNKFFFTFWHYKMRRKIYRSINRHVDTYILKYTKFFWVEMKRPLNFTSTHLLLIVIKKPLCEVKRGNNSYSWRKEFKLNTFCMICRLFFLIAFVQKLISYFGEIAKLSQMRLLDDFILV